MHMRKMQRGNNSLFPKALIHRIVLFLLAAGFIVSTIALSLLLSKNTLLITDELKTRYSVGTLADYDVKANETFFYIDEGATKRAQMAASESIAPHYTYSLVESVKILSLVEDLFSDTPVKGFEAVQQELFTLNNRDVIYPLVFDIVNQFVRKGVYQEEVDKKYSSIEIVNYHGNKSHQQVNLSEVYHLPTAHALAQRELERAAALLHIEIPSYLSTLLVHLIQPNLFYAHEETLLARQIAYQEVEPITIRVEKGEYIVAKDHLITERDLASLQALRLSSLHYSLSQIIGRVIFITLITVTLLTLYSSLFRHNQRRYLYLLFLLVGAIVTQFLVYGVLTIGNWRNVASLETLLPLYALPIFLALVTNKRWAGMIAAILMGSSAILLPVATPTTFFFVIGLSFSGIYSQRFVSSRIDVVLQWAFGIVSAALLVCINFLYHPIGMEHLLQSIIVISINLSLTYILVSLILPLIEYGWNLPTQFKLRELAYGESPLLSRLSQTAIGTYNHSIMVAELAYEGAKAIGANSLLTRVGALYHDVGKMENPDYFIENQSGDNKHDEIKASLSVAIIKSHVKIGVEKAREARLPLEVQDIISQHHGNDVIAIFLQEAQQLAAADGDSDSVKQQDYSYNNPIPKTPEAGIVMIADAVEAASRTLKKPSAQKYERLINQIITGKIERKQLSASRLTLTDIDTLSKTFIQILTGRVHTRIDYPNQVKEALE